MQKKPKSSRRIPKRLSPQGKREQAKYSCPKRYSKGQKEYKKWPIPSIKIRLRTRNRSKELRTAPQKRKMMMQYWLRGMENILKLGKKGSNREDPSPYRATLPNSMTTTRKRPKSKSSQRARLIRVLHRWWINCWIWGWDNRLRNMKSSKSRNTSFSSLASKKSTRSDVPNLHSKTIISISSWESK